MPLQKPRLHLGLIQIHLTNVKAGVSDADVERRSGSGGGSGDGMLVASGENALTILATAGARW